MFFSEKAIQNIKHAQSTLSGSLDTSVVTALGQVLPYFVTAGSALDKFWADNHADWSKEVRAYKSGKKLYLVDLKGTTIELSCVSKEVAARPHS